VSSEPANIPSLIAILLCEQIILEQGSSKKTLVGVFDDLWSTSERTTYRVGFYAKTTDLEGRYRFAIKVVRIAAGAKLWC